MKKKGNILSGLSPVPDQVLKGIQNGAFLEGNIHLKPGKYPIKVKYKEDQGYSRMKLWWKPPGNMLRVILPSHLLTPTKLPPRDM